MVAEILRRFGYTAILLLLFINAGQAQSIDPLAPENMAIIEQNGPGNQANILQQQGGLTGSLNEAIQNQLGLNNQATITQRGSNNHAEQHQDGNNNTLELNQIGEGHSAIQIQRGNNLSHSLTQSGPAGAPVIITQEQF